MKNKKEENKIICPAIHPDKLAELNDLKDKLNGLSYDALMYVKGAVEAIRALQ